MACAISVVSLGKHKTSSQTNLNAHVVAKLHCCSSLAHGSMRLPLACVMEYAGVSRVSWFEGLAAWSPSFRQGLGHTQSVPLIVATPLSQFRRFIEGVTSVEAAFPRQTQYLNLPHPAATCLLWSHRLGSAPWLAGCIPAEPAAHEWSYWHQGLETDVAGPSTVATSSTEEAPQAMLGCTDLLVQGTRTHP